MMNIEQNLKQFAEGLGKNRGRQAVERYASFDYCFNYFQTFREEDKIEELADLSHIQLSSLQLGFYLASWGMLRGSSTTSPNIMTDQHRGSQALMWFGLSGGCFTNESQVRSKDLVTP